MKKARATVNIRKDSAVAPGPVPVPDRIPAPGSMPRGAAWVLAFAGVAIGVGIYSATQNQPTQPSSTVSRAIATLTVDEKPFESTIRAGGTVGAVESAMIRAPRMRGGRDRGGGGGPGGGGGGSVLTIESLATAGTIVQKGDVVAVFESKSTEDMMDTFRSNVAQVQRRSTSQRASLLISSETLRQELHKAQADARKARLDLRTSEVKSKIQAEILALQAEQQEAAAVQLEEEVRLSEIADNATQRSLDIDVQLANSRLERTSFDLDKMVLRTPVSGLVVMETMMQRETPSQAAAGDQVYPGAYFLRIVDLSRMAVFAQLNQADAQLIDIGAPVAVRLDAYPDAVFEGRVDSMGAMAVGVGSSGGGGRGSRGASRSSGGQWVRQVPIEIEILSDDERIKPDLSASGDIRITYSESALVVPRAAIGHSDGGQVVWVQEDDDRFEIRPIEVGLLSDTEATVVSGLTAGEVIAAQPIENSRNVVASRSD